jgi:hypothetical protein
VRVIAPVLPLCKSSSLKSRFDIALATPTDDDELRELLRNTPVPGPIRVTFEREPSFFDSCRIRGDFFQACLGRDRRTGKIIGLGTRSVAPGFINGEPTPLGYLSDLRLEQPYRGGTLIARGYRFLQQLHEDCRTRLYTTVIFSENHAALTTIASGRAGLPRYHDQGTIHSPGINIRRAEPAIDAGCEIIRGSADLLPDVVECLNRNNFRRQFAPVHTVQMFRDRWRNFRIEDFHVAVRGTSVVGVVGCWDQSAFKQTRVAGYGSRLRWMVPLANILRPATRVPRYPKAGEEVPYFYLSFIAIDDNNLQVFRALLRSAYNVAVGTGYLYAILALHERDPLLPALRDYSLTPFLGRLFCVTFDDGEDLVRELDRRVPYLEAATF